MFAIQERIEFYRSDALARLNQEVGRYDGSYAIWYEQLHEVRKFLYSIAVDKRPAYEKPYLVHQHRIDHHIYGYCAPLTFFRKGFGNNIYTPEQQLIDLWQQFEQNGVRFIYVALPCKVAVYQDILLPKALIPTDQIIIPQWRRMLYELIIAGVEVIDLYPYFMNFKTDNRLYSFGHDISCIGSILIANIVSAYLQDTTKGLDNSILGHSKIKARKVQVNEDGYQFDSEQVLLNGAVYTGDEVNSEIGVFGNCNLQKYRGMGLDITSQMANSLSYPVNYLGRRLPFSNSEGPEKGMVGAYNKKIVIYVGFPSAAYVRAINIHDTWATQRIPQSCFDEK